MGKIDIKQWLDRLRKPAHAGCSSVQLGIEMTPTSISVANIISDKKTGAASLRFIHHFYGADTKERQRNFKEFILPNRPKKNLCNLVLHPSYYRLLLVDAPEVPDEELKEAMRWRIKDLISEPIDKVMIDVILLPKDAYEGRMNMVYVAVAPLIHIENCIEILLDSDLMPHNIDIPELALRNIGLQMIKQQASAIVYIREQGSFVSIFTEEQLYLTRNIDITLETLHQIADQNAQHSEQLILEIQRSLDYYESQLGKGSIQQLIFAPAASRGLASSMTILQKNLNCPVLGMDIGTLLQHETELSIPEQAHALPAIGAGLRMTR